MALSDVTFIIQNGGLGRVLTSDDSTSGFVFSDDTKPASLDKTVLFYSLAEAEAAGITASASPELHYHISNFYDQVSAALYVTFSAGNLAQDLHDLQAEAEGAIKQIAVVDPTAFSTASIATLNTAAVQANADHEGFSVLYTGDFGSLTLATLPTLTTFDYPKVSVVIGADAARKEYTAIGATLGTVAAANVAYSIAYVRSFNVVKTGEFETLGFATGEDYKAVSKAQLGTLKDKGYIFLRKFTGKAGSYFSESSTATSTASDYATIENNRTMEKAQRGIRTALIDELNSPLSITEDGKLTTHTIAKFDLLVRNVLDTMKANGEVSAFAILVDPNQKVLSTSKLEIKVLITPLGVARQIVVPIGFEIKLANG
jgi:hypothetical protein